MLILGDSRMKYEFVCHFELVADMIRDGVREVLNDKDQPAFLEKKLIEFGVDEYQ